MSTAEAPTSPESIGLYRLLEPLGRGGMGVVYRAVHMDTGEHVALKTVRLPSESLLQAIRREIFALTRIQHPGVIRILDSGVANGMPWYAMELLHGVTLGHYAGVPGLPLNAETIEVSKPLLATPWWTNTLEPSDDPIAVGLGASSDATPGAGPLRGTLTLIRRLCVTLAFLHGEGIVHRDLKPDNVLVRSNGMPVLVDFGLVSKFAAEVSRELLDVGGLGAGTLAYMAPEQLTGSLVDARADLYALGCILYERLTGRPPFTGASTAELCRAHLQAEPLPPSYFARDLPDGLDALVLKLLAKRPQQRIGHATDVASALAELGAEDDFSSVAPVPRAYLYRPGFVGRSDAVERIKECLAGAEDGRGALLLVDGESGVGKTRVLLEAAREATRSRFTVMISELAGTGPGAPLSFLKSPLQQLADLCRARGAAETERLLGRRGKLLALYEPGLADVPGLQHYPDPQELPPEAGRLRLFSELTETFLALARQVPLLLVLDDLQWADELSLDWLEHLWRSPSLTESPVVVLGAVRSDEAGTNSSSLRRLMEARGLPRIALGRLQESEVGAMAGDMLALPMPPATFVRFLTDHTEGNPFFVAEYLRAALSEGLLTRDALGRWQLTGEVAAVPLPGSIRDLVARRLESLTPAGLALAEAACVLGREVEEPLLVDVASSLGMSALEGVSELMARQIFELAPANRLRFVHDKLREVANTRLSPERAPLLHRAAAEVLSERPGSDPAVLGQHWEKAFEASRARSCYLAAAKTAGARYAHAETERLYRAYLRLSPVESQETLDARHELATTLHIQGRTSEAIAEEEGALGHARRLGKGDAEARLLLRLGNLYWRTGQMARAAELIHQSLELARQIGDRAQEGAALGSLGILHAREGRWQEAVVHYEHALAIHRQLGTRERQSVNLGNLAILFQNQGQFERALALLEEALTIARQDGDRLREGVHVGNLASVHQEMGHLDDSLHLHEQALLISREVGDRRSEAVHLGNIALVEQQLGQLERPRMLLEQTLAIAREIRDTSMEGHTLRNLAVVHQEQGHPGSARVLLERALERHRETGDRRLQAHALIACCTLERRVGEVEKATIHVQQADALLAATGDKVMACICLCERGHLALAASEGAGELLDQARHRARELSAGPKSALGEAVARLERAVAAFAAGEPLWQGERAGDLPPGLRQHLNATGRLATRPEPDPEQNGIPAQGETL